MAAGSTSGDTVTLAAPASLIPGEAVEQGGDDISLELK